MLERLSLQQLHEDEVLAMSALFVWFESTTPGYLDQQPLRAIEAIGLDCEY